MHNELKKTLSLLSPQLQAFLAVAKHKSIHGGAKAVHISQTAMTQRIHTLESKLATTLFVRTRQGVRLTSEGEALLRYCNAVLELSGETLSKIVDAGKMSTIRVSITGPSSIMIARVIPQCLTVMKKFPKLLINFDINDTNHRIHSLRTGTNQFAIIEPEIAPKEMKIKVLSVEKYFLVCSHQWKERQISDILKNERIIDFDENDSMSYNYLKHYKLIKQAQTERLFVNRTESLAKMICEGFGYGVLTEEFSQKYLDTGELITLNHGKVYENQLALAWYPRPELPAYLAKLISAIN